jgi:uncharacterized protein YqgV (UPF0045/DUF77 family)
MLKVDAFQAIMEAKVDNIIKAVQERMEVAVKNGQEEIKTTVRAD